MNYRLLGTFGSFSPQKEDYEKSDVVIVPVGYEESTCYIPGTKFGPGAIIEASHYMEFYDIEMDCDVSRSIGIYTTSEPEFSKDSMDKAMGEIESFVGRYVREGKFVVTLGGEHSITPPLLRAFKGVHGDLSVLQFDAHGDMRDSYEGSRQSHACAMRRSREICPVVQVGIRSMCLEEADFLRRNGLAGTVHYAKDVDSWDDDAIIGSLSENVYITFDFDYFDPSIMPSVGTPEPGGPDWYRTLRLLRRCFEKRNVVGVDAVELCPAAGCEHASFTAASLIYKMITYKFAPLVKQGNRGGISKKN